MAGGDEGNRAPPSRRIADELRRAILSGEFEPGAVLPSERTLAASYGTARNTARQAIALLQAEGLVEAQHGRGVFVREHGPVRRLAHDRYARRHRDSGRAPFREEAEREGREARVEVLSIGWIDAPKWIAARLGLDDGEQVLLRRNRYLADDVPVQLADTYLPSGIAAGTALEREIPAAGGIYAALEALGHGLVRLEEEVTARMPVPEEAEVLRLSRGVPVIELVHVSFDKDGHPIDVTHSLLPADRNVLVFQLPVD